MAEIPSKKADTKKIQPTVKSSARKFKTNTLICSIFFALLLIGFGFCWIQFSSLQQSQKQMEANNVALKQEQTNLFNQLKSQIEQDKKTFDTSLKTALANRPEPKEDWILLKARYYLELAQINAHWAQDSQVLLALLTAADNLLKGLNIQPIFSIRQTLAKEIASIQSIKTVDIAGILSQLDAANKLVNQLTLTQLQPSKITPPVTSENTGWKGKWRESLDSLKKIIVIRHNNENPYSVAQQRLFARENLHFHLLAVQWAVLHQNELLYHQTLQESIRIIQENYVVHDTTTDNLLTQLKRLDTYSLKSPALDIQQSLEQLNQYIDSAAQRGLSTAGENKS